MSTENSISIEIPEAEQQIVSDALSTVISTLSPYLVALTPDQRRTIPKMGDGTEPFVSKVMDYAQSDPDFVPPYVDVAEMNKDFTAVNQLVRLQRLVDQLQSNLNDSIMLAGSEAYISALSYYNSVKMAARMNVPGAKAIYEDLKKRFESQGPRRSSGTE